MFVRTKTTPNSPRKSIQICENKRNENGKVQQKILRHIGIANNEWEEKKLKDYAQEVMENILIEREKEKKQLSLFERSQQDMRDRIMHRAGRPRRKSLENILPPSQVLLSDIEEESRFIEGVHDIGGSMFDELYGELLNEKRARDVLRDVVLTRLVFPCSKRSTQRKLANNFGRTHSLERIYQMMDKVFPTIGKMKELTFKKTQSLFPDGVDLLLFDVTTLYFESTEVDELRNFGYSKDHRFNTTQLVLALATNQDGLPVGYELFEGNKAEVATLLIAIESWKTFFPIASVCFVGDRAMFTKANLALLEEHRCHYIIAAKLKMLPKAFQNQLFDENNYRVKELNNQLTWIGEFEHQNARLIVSYKSKRALKDQQERQHVIDKVRKIIGKKGNPNRLITNAGVKKFVTKDDNASITLDQEKIAQAAQWDGLHGIITNIKSDDPACLLARYARLWVIEESFRINKHTLKMRPIFHWTPSRIHAHIAICYMTFSVLRHLQYRINLTQKISIDEILDELVHVQASIHVHKKTKDRYRVPGYFSNNARKIYRAFGLKRSLDATVYLP